MSIFNVISLLGGLALFLYGMSLMSDKLEKLAGGKLEQIFGAGIYAKTAAFAKFFFKSKFCQNRCTSVMLRI